jgi:hypothetical protein
MKDLSSFTVKWKWAIANLVTVSTDSLTETNEYRSGVGAHWPFLSDAGRVVQKDLDIAEYTEPLHNPMIPHVVVLEPDLIIYRWQHAKTASALWVGLIISSPSPAGAQKW